jgi:TolB protein
MRSWLRLLGALGALAAPAWGQVGADEVRVGTSEGRERIDLLLPELAGDPAAGGVIRGVVHDDLHFSGLFELSPADPATAYTLSGTVETASDKHVVTVSVTEAGEEGAPVMGKRFRGGADSLRRIGHRIADEVVRAFTGRPGPFDSRIAFVSDTGGQRDVYLMDYDGANVSRVTRDGAIVLSPEVSFDGQLLVFTSFVGGAPAVWVVRRDTGEMRKLFQREGLNQSPSLGPDGRQLLVSASFEGNSEIYLTDLRGSTLKRLTDSPGIDVSPAWSPTGREMAFTSDRTGTPQVHLATAEGLDVRRVTLEGDYNSEPAWSPDGTRLAYSTRRAGVFQVAVLDVQTGQSTVVTTGACNHESPSWSPDGELLAYASDCDGKYDIWITRRDGSEPRRVGTRGSNRQPCWYR